MDPGKTGKAIGKTASAIRKERLARQLRANLKRRKAAGQPAGAHVHEPGGADAMPARQESPAPTAGTSQALSVGLKPAAEPAG
ncbi:MAG: hypothetical protein MUC58_04715 [Rhizobiaceae bacterium]|jgi:hypothetical protein|nr:hypothetical protein [Rhizobiaceae bacterium]